MMKTLSEFNEKKPKADDELVGGAREIRVIKTALAQSFQGFSGMISVLASGEASSTSVLYTVRVVGWRRDASLAAGTLLILRAPVTCFQGCAVRIGEAGEPYPILNTLGHPIPSGDIEKDEWVLLLFDGAGFRRIASRVEHDAGFITPSVLHERLDAYTTKGYLMNILSAKVDQTALAALSERLETKLEQKDLTGYVQKRVLADYVQNTVFDARLSEKADKTALQALSQVDQTALGALSEGLETKLEQKDLTGYVQNSELTNYVQNSELTNYVQNSELTNYVQN
ncbi:MAG: hypothetical protein N0E59_02200, partial [Candidatus Thiodiazotropha taylori]|nr:hypothetical protein [Candidatus Thiodiazotropha taylori]MCW4281026.1 hypothetical protein [Candidatus Thiodiazotropha taylori]MCW4281895.1 hypothetical protein [Candidatus Thiodiazotropha taylori]